MNNFELLVSENSVSLGDDINICLTSTVMESGSDAVPEIHPVMRVADLVNVIFEYSNDSAVCREIHNPEFDNLPFYQNLKIQYQNLHFSHNLNHSLDTILLCINGTLYVNPRKYCLEASKRVRDFVINMIKYEIAALELCQENDPAYRSFICGKGYYFDALLNYKSNFNRVIKIKEERLRNLETKFDFSLLEEFTIINRELDRSHKILNEMYAEHVTEGDIKNLENEGMLKNIPKLNLKPTSDKRTLTILPHTIGQLLGLQELDISENRIQYLPVSINNLQNLTCLKAANNNLQQLPQGFPSHPNFICLDLNQNKLGNVNHIFPSLLNIETLGLSFKWHGILSEEVGVLTHLKTLYFDNLDLLFPFLDHFSFSTSNIKIFTNLAYLEANAHLLSSINDITFDTYMKNGMDLNTLIKIKNYKDNLEKEKREEFENESKMKEEEQRKWNDSNEVVRSRTCIIS